MIDIADPDLGKAEWNAVRDVLATGTLAAGDQVDQFEAEFADRCGSSHGIATSNGTTALHATLEALDLPVGTKVVTTPFTFVATANAIRHAGLDPLFVDVDPETFTIDPDAVETAMVRHGTDVGAILPVHLYGLPADMVALRAIADEYDVALVEDAAQAHDARIDGRPVGTFGDAATFSFYPTKNMTTGEGGMVTTDDAALADRVREFVDHGRAEASYDHATVGHNFRLTDIAAAIGRVQLRKLDGFTEARRSNASRYAAALADSAVDTPVEPEGRHHVYHQYTVRSDRRDELVDHLTGQDIGTAVYYPTPIHELPPYRGRDVDLPVAERLAEEVLSLPVHPGVTEAEIGRVADAIDAFERVSA